jgi:YegS/Rv2252/BmrU family lipid kinase
MQKVIVYLNKIASNSNFDYWKETIQKPLFRSEISFRSPTSLLELNSLIQADLKNNVEVIIAVGGDGTVNNIIQQLVGHRDVGLLVIPAGTANDLATELGNTNFIKDVLGSVRTNDYKFIDIIRVNSQLMATNGGIGLGGDVANQVNELRAKYPLFKTVMKYTGDSIYSLFTGLHLLNPFSHKYSLRIEAAEFQGDIEAHALLINNQKMLGGKFAIAPDTKNNDGTFNVTALVHKYRHKLIRSISQIASENFPVNDQEIITFETKHLKIYNKNPKQVPLFFGDGEILAKGEQYFEIDIFPQALKVFSKTGLIHLDEFKNEVFLQ